VDYVNKWLRLKVTREWYAGSKESAALQILPVVTGVNITTTTEDVGRNTTRTFKAEVVGKGAPLPQGVTWSIADKDDNPIAWASISSNGVLSVASNAPTGETITVTAVSEFAPEHSRAVEVAVVADFLWLQPEAEDAPVIGNKAGGFIAYGNDIFLLIGEGSVYHSEDGISWELKDASFDKDFYFLEGSDIKCINGRFFGETSDGLSYSTDGTSWEPASGLDADFQVFSAAFGKDLFVAVGNEGKVAWSLEGEDWTQLENEKLPFYEHGFIGNSTIIGNIAFGNGRFVALGESGEFSYSGDGTNWTRPTMQQVFTSQLPQGPGYNGPKITGLAFGNGKFVAVNKSGEVAWSENGENEESWDEVRDTKFSGSTINAIAFGGGKFLAAGADGRAAYSTNGNEWVDVSVPGGVDFDTHGIAYGNGRFVVVSDTGKIAYSNLQE
jgi:hypothetical protein